jgi:hypothetical protein
MNHKRKRPKTSRAGCLMCKPHKAKMLGVTWLLRRQQLRQHQKWKALQRAGEV